MIRIVFIVIICISILLESTVFPFPSTLIIFMLMAPFMGKGISIWAFVIGLILDIFSGRILGSSSLFFLSTVWISWRYRKKLHPGNFYYQLVFLLLALIIYSFIFYKYLDLGKFLVVILCCGIIFKVLKGLFPEIGGKQKLIVE